MALKVADFYKAQKQIQKMTQWCNGLNIKDYSFDIFTWHFIYFPISSGISLVEHLPFLLYYCGHYSCSCSMHIYFIFFTNTIILSLLYFNTVMCYGSKSVHVKAGCCSCLLGLRPNAYGHTVLSGGYLILTALRTQCTVQVKKIDWNKKGWKNTFWAKVLTA